MSGHSHKKPSELLERMRAATTREKSGSQEASPPVSALPPAAEPAKRVRYTLDLSKEQHRFLKRFALDAEVDASAVARVLLSLLETDQDVADRVLDLLRQEG